MAATMQPQSQAFTPPVITSKEDILRFMMSLERSISRKELISRGLTRSTATRYLKQLVADGSIERMCYGHCQLTGKGRAWARVPPDSRYGGSLRQLDHDSTEDQNGDQAAQKGSRVPQNGGYGNKTNYIDEVTAQSARKETDNDSNCYPHPRFRQPGNDSNLSLARQPHESRSDSSRPAFRWMNRNDLPAAIHRLLQQCSKSALKFRNKTILEAKENRRSVPQTQLIDVPTYRLEAMNIDKYFRWNDRGLYVGLKESYLGSFHSTMVCVL